MTKTEKILNIALRSAAALFIFIAFLTLLIPSPKMMHTNMWAINNYDYSRTDLESKTEFDSECNFFGVMGELKDEGFGVGLEVIIVILLVVTLAFLVLSIFFKPLRKIYFIAIPLLLTVLLVVWDSSNYGLEYALSGPNFIGSYQGHNIYVETTMSFRFSTLPGAFLSAFATLHVLALNIIDIVRNKRQKEAALQSENTSSEKGEIEQTV